jgi:hypothetical protein
VKLLEIFFIFRWQVNGENASFFFVNHSYMKKN